MNSRSLFKSISLALLAFSVSQACLAMEKENHDELIIKKIRTNYDYTLLAAARYGNIIQANDALEHGANINCIDPRWFGWTPLHHASRKGHLDIVKRLLEYGANINYAPTRLWSKVDFFGVTPLHCAASEDKVKVVKELLDNGADINCVTSDGKTALSMATPKVLKLISNRIEYHAIVSARLLVRALDHNDATLEKLLLINRK
jgi:ankyrin repeat protein